MTTKNIIHAPFYYWEIIGDTAFLRRRTEDETCSYRPESIWIDNEKRVLDFFNSLKDKGCKYAELPFTRECFEEGKEFFIRNKLKFEILSESRFGVKVRITL